MKTINNDAVAPTSFQPIAVTILIETQEEYDALDLAKQNLCGSDIRDQYSWNDRCIWVDALDCIADGMRRKS